MRPAYSGLYIEECTEENALPISPFRVLLASFIPLLFAPAGLMLLVQVAIAPTVAESLIALALALFCPELAYMARVDLQNVMAIAPEEDSRLDHFYPIVVSTIVLEITGLYTALLSPHWGAMGVIASQIWFNLLAKIQLFPGEVPAIRSFGVLERRPVLIANGIGLGLLLLWPVQIIRIWLAAGLLFLIVLFLIIKYGVSRLSLDHHEPNSLKLNNPKIDRANSDRTP